MLFFKIYKDSLSGFHKIIDSLGFPTISSELSLALEGKDLEFPIYLVLSGYRFYTTDENYINSYPDVTLVKVKPNIKIVKSANTGKEVSRKETVDIYPNIRLSNVLMGKTVFKASEDIYQNKVLRFKKGTYFTNKKGTFIVVDESPTFTSVRDLPSFYEMGDAIKIIETR